MLLRKVLNLAVVVIIIGTVAVVSSARAEVKQPQQAEDKVAIVNGEPITRGEFDGEVLRVQKGLLEYGKPLSCSQLASVRKEVLEGMVRREVLYQASIKAGIKADDEAVSKGLKTLRQQFTNEEEYKNELSRRNISEEILRSRMEKNSSIQQYVERLTSNIKVADSDMVAYYQGHVDLFRQPLQVRVSHILIQTDPAWAEPRRQEARRKAEQVLQDLKKRKDFAAIAREQSDGPTRANGGDLGYIKAGQLEKPFEGAVFALQPGETTNIIETENGFHLFKVTDKKPESVLAYENVKDKIRQFISEEKAKQEAELQAKALREKANVEILLQEDNK